MTEFKRVFVDTAPIVYLMLQELAKEVLMISKNENDSNEVALTGLGAS